MLPVSLRSAVVPLTLTALLSATRAAARSAEDAVQVWHVAQTEIPGIPGEVRFRTIGEAAARAEAGDTVLIHGGVYRERVVVEAGGEAGKPITFAAAPGAHVVVTGADEITDWERAAADRHVYRTPWPHAFITWSERGAHPDDDYHIVVGRAEQVFIDGYPLHQVLSRNQMSRGSFFVDLEAQRLYVWGYHDEALDERPRRVRVEASSRPVIWEVGADHVHLKGLRFRYAANHAQQGAVQFRGDHIVVEDCVFERANAAGASFRGSDIVVRNCTFQDNGQLGFGASRAHRLLITGCLVRNNNTRGWDRGWEAGGNKICLSRGVVIENSTFIENRGSGIWFDIGNEDCVVRNCLIADNEDAGIFYEISYGLHAHDNVIMGNGFAEAYGSWGVACGISLSSSPGCVIERNLIVGNKEGLSFREQLRTTPLIDRRGEEPVWNRDHVMRNNVIAYNRDAQVWGWFDVGDQRHWPAAKQEAATLRPAGEGHPAGLTLETLNLRFADNVYYAAPGQGFVNWGVTWDAMHRRYASLDEVRHELGLDQGGVVAEPGFASIGARDLRVPAGSVLLRMGCYPRGEVPGVRLGVRSSPGKEG